MLKQINERLEEEGFHPIFRLIEWAGKSGRTKDLYGVFLGRRGEVVSLAEKLLPYSRHDEKVAWMKLILEIKDEKYWDDVKDRVLPQREKIEEDTEACVKEAEKKYKTNHNGKDWFEVHSHSIT